MDGKYFSRLTAHDLRCEHCEDDLRNISVPSALKRMTFAIEVKMFERISLLPRDWHA